MFEGLVRKLLLGSLGRYVKDIQLDKLNFGLQELVLNDVELNLEAFDYLQLPFSLKQGRVGKLIIKIPWKLGWGPIIITLEDIFICACPWDDQEWSRDAIERREIAAKKAKLAAAELAKLSKRVCDSKAGKSFKSYMMAKVLDSIQVSIRNVHVIYCDRKSELAPSVLGLRFSSLTILKQNPIGSFSGNSRSSQVHTTVKLLALEIYCGTSKGIDSKIWTNAQFEGDKYCYLLAPVDISVSLLMDRSGMPENDAPQYSISAESSSLVMSLDEVQLQQVFMLWDNICINRMREKYGQHRPWANPLSKKLNGWQIAWWHYAQQSILSDVRKKMKKTSWRYCGERMTNCRKYVNLYKAKLEFLRQEQPNNEYIFRELELMEKESDIEDILNYRSIAEYEMQESTSNSSASHLGTNGTEIAGEKLQNDDRSSSWSRGWLYWLPHGMLGAGGTEDSGQFSGVVSDDVVRDIREATDFDPGSSSHGDAAVSENFFLSAIKFSIPQIIMTVRSRKLDQEIAELTFGTLIIESEIWQDFATITTLVNSMEIAYPCNNKVILHARKAVNNIEFGVEQPSVSLQIDVSPLNQDVELLVKVLVQPLEITLDLEFLSNFFGFYSLVESFEFHQARVLSSLDGIENVKVRLLSKAEYIFSSRKKVNWDVGFINTVVRIPWTSANLEHYELVLECGSLFIVSKLEIGSFIEDELHILNTFLSSVCTSDFSLSFQLQDLYDHFEIKLNDCEMKISMPLYPQIKLVLEKFGSHMTVATCVIPDESILKQLQVYVVVSSLCASLSPMIFGAVLGLISHIEFWLSKFKFMMISTADSLNITSRARKIFSFSIIANLESVFSCIDLFNDGDNKASIMLALHELDVRFAASHSEECWICLKALEIFTKSEKEDENGHILCSSGNTCSAYHHGVVGGHSPQSDLQRERSSSADGCFLLHYETCNTADFVNQKCTVFMNDVDLHCYPYIIGLLVSFCDRIPDCGVSDFDGNSIGPTKDAKNSLQVPGFAFTRFGFSNFCDFGSSELASIPLDHFPFVTIYNSGSLSHLEASLIHAIPEWRKYFRLTERKVRSPKDSRAKRSKIFHASPLKCMNGAESFPVSASSGGSSPFFIDLNLTGIRVQFHDSSCIIATLTLAIFKSSVSINETCLDIMCSTERPTLSSSWSCQNLQESLWGPLLPNILPVLNVRVRKGRGESTSSQFDVSISIQHVSCILPPEFLAIVIGYFSLPDWTYSVNEPTHAHIDMARGSIVYKFEILDSALLVPTKSSDNHFLKLDLQQLYCSFFEGVVKDIPPECCVPEHKFEDEDHFLNIFGREMSLSLILPLDAANDAALFGQSNGRRSIALVDSLSADFWVRIPSETEASCVSAHVPTCVMVRIQCCQLTAEGRYVFHGYEALLDVIDQFSSVGEESKCFTHDVLQFLHLKKCLEEKGPVSGDALSMASTEIKCCVNSLSIKLGHTRCEPNFGFVAQTDMQFTCAASLKNDILFSLEATFYSLVLHSFQHSRVLAHCTSSCSNSSVLGILFSKSDKGGNALRIMLPSLNIWLHSSDWTELIDLVDSYIGCYGETFVMEPPSKNLTLGSAIQNENAMVTDSQHDIQSPSMSNYLAPENSEQDTILSMKLEDIGITIHVPMSVSKNGEFCKTEVQEQKPLNMTSNMVGGKIYKCITITLHSGSSELVFRSRSVRILSNLEKTNGSVVIYEGSNVHSWPFFQLFQIGLEVEIFYSQMEPVSAKAEVRSDGIDVCLSHQVLFFWHDLSFEIAKAGHSQFVFGKIHLEAQLRKISLLLMDGRWGCNGPLVEILLSNSLLLADVTPIDLKGSVQSELQVNYNNIHKVLWEPFVEPCEFQLNIVREHGKSALLNNDVMTDIVLESLTQLNLNFTESLTEAVFRVIEMIKDAWGFVDLNDYPESQELLKHQNSENECTEKYAPYILQNLTSLPLVFHVCKGLDSFVDSDVSMLKDGKLVEPGSSFPIHVDETPEQQFFRFRPAHSSDRLNERQSNWVAHHYISVQLNGTSMPSPPISMDLVGLTYFEVDFSNASKKTEATKPDNASKYNKLIEEMSDVDRGFIVPVVVDVSIQRYSKLVRLYSTVILLNATSVPFELRFDIPFGVSPKILDPIYPGQEFPLPLHLAEAGRMRWRPLGSTYLWSEVHNLANIIAQENRIGYLRSFVCYPSHPSSDPFRCCMSVQDINLLSGGMARKGSALDTNDSIKCSVEGSYQKNHSLGTVKKRCIHHLRLSAPLVVKNFLPEAVSLIIESGGITRNVLLKEVETSFFHVDTSHDLGLKFHIRGFKPSLTIFPRSENFSAVAKFDETKFTVSETMTLDPDLCPRGPLQVIVEKAMDVFSGAREICIYVPFLLYNCAGFPLTVTDSPDGMRDHLYIIPSCYNLGEQKLHGRKDSLSFVPSDENSYSTVSHSHNLKNLYSKGHIVSSREIVKPCLGICPTEPSILPHEHSQKYESRDAVSVNLNGSSSSSIQSKLQVSDPIKNECIKVQPYMYSPLPNSSSSEIMVRVSRYLPECASENIPTCSWSNHFTLVPPTGPTNVLVPQLSKNAAYIITVTSSSVPGQLLGRTKAITFQPRYVLSNACSKNLCYKQKGTDIVFQLGMGMHTHLHWADTTRELLVSVCFSEPGWEWSGCFRPEDLGDTQVKMRNYDSGAVEMVRVEVQNADVSSKDEKILGSPHGNSGTNLILLSDDDTGFMPYRIDNFSKERLRIYQQKCDTFATMVHSYTSCPYAWDEPCYPHRLTVEVPGECVVGSYSLDDVREFKSINLSSTSEKPERTLLVSLRPEGAMKVLSVIDSSYHILKNVKDHSAPWFRDNRKNDQKRDTSVDYKERISVIVPSIGISLISSYPKELVFACAKNTRIDLLQTLDQQKFSFQTSSLQIDNQLHSTPYPVILSFDHQFKSNPAVQMKTKANGLKSKGESMVQAAADAYCEPVFCLAVARWRNKDVSCVSFEYICFRVADFHLELDQEIIFSLVDFSRIVFARSHSNVSPYMSSTLRPSIYNTLSPKQFGAHAQDFGHLKVDEYPFYTIHIPAFVEDQRSDISLPSVVPIGAPWQQIYLLARRQKKVYVEFFDLAPIKLTFSFSSTPWLLRNGILTSGDSLLQRGLMALADVEGAKIHLKPLTIVHHMASWDSIEQILVGHYSRQILHEMYKVFGSAGVIGNPMGFARSLGLGIKDFLSVPARSTLQSPTGLITGMAQGTTSLLSNTVYAVSDAATQFSRAAQKGIVALTFDDQDVAKREMHQKSIASHSNGVINEFLEGLTGLLQSPIRGAEKHGLPGVFSGLALGVTGLVAKPAASILEVTGKTAQSIRNRSKLYQGRSQHLRLRLPRPLSRELPLRPYSWEEAVAASVLAETEEGIKVRDEMLIVCKMLKEDGKFVLVTERLLMVVGCSSLVGMRSPEFKGVATEPQWVIEAEIWLENVIHADNDEGVIHIIGSNSDNLLRQNQLEQRRSGGRRSYPPTQMPLFQTSLEFACKEEADEFLQIFLSAVEHGKERGRGGVPYLLHQRILR